MDESPPMAISASQELLKAAPCIVPAPDPIPVIGSVFGSGIIGGESLEDFRLSFSIFIQSREIV